MSSSTYYVFDIPEKVKSDLQPFKLSAENGASESDNDLDSNSSDSDSGSESEDENEKPAQVPAQSYSSTHNTQYNDDYETDEHYKQRMLAHISGHPYVYFTSPAISQDMVLAVYKPFFTKEEMVSHPCETVKQFQSQGQSAVLMLGGGHFSGAIISHKRGNQKLNISNPFSNLMILKSKSFHRYTTRKKQGGAQSASDNANGKANSAGSTIRRQMEAQLKAEIGELLHSWSEDLKKCQFIFIRAAGRTNNGILTGEAGSAAIAKDDQRIRSIPFTTKRATVNEVKNVWLQLTKAQVLPAPKEELPQVQPAAKEAKPKKEVPKKEPSPQLSPDELHTEAILGMIKKSETGALIRYLQANELSLDFKLQPADSFRSTPTPLLHAAKSGKHQVVTSLLNNGADPTITGSAKNNGVWELASSNEKVRNALQIARKFLGESKWNWDSTQIGPAMSAEEIKARDTAKALADRLEREAQISAADKKAKKDRMEKLINRPASAKHTAPANSGMNGLSAKDAQQIERERRARAAEARLAKMGMK